MKLKIILTIFIPLMITLFLVIFLPTSLIILANPQQQAKYVSQEINNHGIDIRNILFQDRKIVQKLFQSCQDIRNSLMNLFVQKSNFQQTYPDIILNTAKNYNDQVSYESMYYNTTQQNQIYNNYLQIELFTRALVPNNPNIINLTWTFQSGIQFWFPSSPIDLPQTYLMFNQKYNNTMSNFINKSQQYSVYLSGQMIEICTVIYLSPNTPLGVMCLMINGSSLLSTELIINIQQMDNLTLATTVSAFSTQVPNVVFVSNSNSNFVFPNSSLNVDQLNLNIDFNVLSSTWEINYNYSLLIQVFPFKIWYQTPISLINYQGSVSNVFFLCTEYLINLQQYTFQVGKSYLIQVIVIPLVLFGVSLIVSYFILNKIVNNIVLQINVLVYKSKSLLQDDLEIQIPQYKQTQQIQNLYQKFQTFSNVFKFSEKSFFSGNHTQKTVKYYKALKLFGDFNNAEVVGSIYQNLANLSNQQQNLQKASQYYKASLNSISQIIISQFSQRINVKTVKQIYQYLYKHKKRIPSSYRNLQITLIRRFYNYIETSFRLEDKSSFGSDQKVKKLVENLDEFSIILKQKSNDPTEIFIKIMSAQIYLATGWFDLAEQNLLEAERLYKEYQLLHQKDLLIITTPPQILYQYLSLVWGNYSEQQNKHLQAFQYYVAAFDGQTYEPIMRQKLLHSLKKLLITQNLHSTTVRQSIYYQTKSNEPRQFFLIVDFSLSMATKVKVKSEVFTRTRLAINQALRIFDEHINLTDRVSFVKFESGIQQVFNLTQKGKYQRMLRGTIEQFSKSQLKEGTAIFNTLKVLLLNTKSLKKQKILIFIIDGQDNCSNIGLDEIEQIIKSLDLVTLLFIYIDMKQRQLSKLYELRNFCQSCFFVSIYAQDDINRILKGKSYFKHYPQSYIL